MKQWNNETMKQWNNETMKQWNNDISKIICKTLFLFPNYLRENIGISKDEFKEYLQNMKTWKHENMKTWK
jgi:hypothetical protein